MSTQPVATDALSAREQRARAWLAEGKFRKARDEFKELCKIDRARFLPLLVDANLGLAREMTAKGMVREAEQVIAYVKTLSPLHSGLAMMSRDTALKSGKWEDIAKNAASQLTSAADAPAGDGAMRIRIADELILGGAADAGTPETQAVIKALRLLGEGHSQQALECVREVPRSAACSHWVFFIRGLAALYSEERTRAAKMLEAIPDASLLAGSRDVLLAICGRGTASDLNPSVVRGLCQWLGVPALPDPLLEADRHWRAGRRADAAKVLCSRVRGLPAWDAHSVTGTLTRFFFQSAAEDRAGGTLRAFLAKPCNDKTLSVWRSFARHMEVSIATREDEGVDTLFLWDLFVREEAPVLGLSVAMQSRLFGEVGRRCMEQKRLDEAREVPGSETSSGTEAKNALTKAILLDPGNLRAAIDLCDVLSAFGDKTGRNRLLDDLTKRFPEEKEVLLRTGEECYNRKSLTKALKCFEKAYALDSVDPRIAEHLAVTRLGLLVEGYKKNAGKARAGWPAIMELAVDSPDDSDRSRWSLLTRRAVMETCYGDAAEGKSFLAQALARAPGPAVVCFLAGLTARCYDRKSSDDWWTLAGVSRDTLTLPDLALVPPLLIIWQQRLSSNEVYLELRNWQKCVAIAVSRPHDRADAVRFVLALFALKTTYYTSGMQDLIAYWLQKNRQDRFFKTFEALFGQNSILRNFHREVLNPDQMMEAATRAGDVETQSLLNLWQACTSHRNIERQSDTERWDAETGGRDMDTDGWEFEPENPVQAFLESGMSKETLRNIILASMPSKKRRELEQLAHDLAQLPPESLRYGLERVRAEDGDQAADTLQLLVESFTGAMGPDIPKGARKPGKSGSASGPAPFELF